MRTIGCLAVFLTLVTGADLQAEDWLHWRGEAGNGISSTATPPTRWSETENVKWKTAVPGQGSGSPIVVGNRVFVVSGVPAPGSGSEQPETPSRRGGRSRGRGFGGPAGPLPTLEYCVFCYDRETGQLQWKQVATVGRPHEGTHSTNNFASGSPCSDGERVYAHFGSRGLYCYSLDGKLIWSRDFGDMQTRNTFGEGSSPTLFGDVILVPWDHEGPSALFCLDKLSGKTIWKADRDEPTNWSTPLVIATDSGEQVVMNGQNKARAYDLKTGREIWSCGGQTERPAASAVSGHGIVFVGSGFRGSFLGAFRPDGAGDISGTENVVWSVSRDTPDIASPLLSGNRLYYYKAKNGIITCVDALTGKPLIPTTRVPGLDTIYASPVAAAGHVYLSARNGTTTVIRDADAFEVVSQNSIGETIDATPAPVDNQLFIRGERHLFCIEE